MIGTASLYAIPPDYETNDPDLEQRMADIVHSAAIQLEKSQLIKYDRRTGHMDLTDLARIASYFYVSHDTIATFNKHLKPTLTEIELLHVFALSDEFKYLTVRGEEKPEIEKLMERVPIP